MTIAVTPSAVCCGIVQSYHLHITWLHTCDKVECVRCAVHAAPTDHFSWMPLQGAAGRLPSWARPKAVTGVHGLRPFFCPRQIVMVSGDSNSCLEPLSPCAPPQKGLDEFSIAKGWLQASAVWYHNLSKTEQRTQNHYLQLFWRHQPGGLKVRSFDLLLIQRKGACAYGRAAQPAERLSGTQTCLPTQNGSADGSVHWRPTIWTKPCITYQHMRHPPVIFPSPVSAAAQQVNSIVLPPAK